MEHVRAVYSTASGLAREPKNLVSSSWARCLNEYGLDPALARAPLMLDAVKLMERTERMSALVDCAKIEMANLYQQLADTQSAVVLTDADGAILSVVGEARFTRAAAHLGLKEGAVWSEREQGTNGMGTCLVEKTPLVIHRDQHFLARNINLTCTAAPIFDSQGKLAAVLDVSSQSVLAQQYSTVLVGMSAQMIENRTLLARHRDDFIVRFHGRPEFIYTLHEGVLAMSGEGRLVAANRSALFQLGVSSFSEIGGCEIGALFNSRLPDLLQRSVGSSFHPVAIYGARGGSRFFAVAHQPERAARHHVLAVGLPSATRVGAEPVANPMSSLETSDVRMAHNVRCVLRVINRGIPILICGETGSGKDLFAKAIHAASSRASGPFVAVNCASLPETLIESELFGYKSGAFTGASREGRRGKIIQASGGTLFLDEIGDMPLALQARLLRVLEEWEVVPLGGEVPVAVDIQLISATHRDLQAMVKRGEFREDLYYRLQGIMLSLPPLRERTDRRALIALTLREEAAGEEVSVEPEAMKLLECYEWPGNVRQLRNVLRTALALSDAKVIRCSDLPEELRKASGQPVKAASLPEAGLNSLEAAERSALIQALEQHRWNISSLALELKTSRNTLYRKMKRLSISSHSGGRYSGG
jgi:transcriptional regulator of acetoin/glycerol metabolism